MKSLQLRLQVVCSYHATAKGSRILQHNHKRHAILNVKIDYCQDDLNIVAEKNLRLITR